MAPVLKMNTTSEIPTSSYCCEYWWTSKEDIHRNTVGIAMVDVVVDGVGRNVNERLEDLISMLLKIVQELG